MGFRAAEAWVRPSPIKTNGKVSHYAFDLWKCTFEMSLTAKVRTEQDAPTELYLPDYHFPAAQTVLTVSDGEWTIDYEEVNGVKVQHLKWWHPEGDQDIKVEGVKHKPGELINDPGEEISYLEQCQKEGCVVM